MAITISDSTPRVQYTATGGQTTFAVNFEFFVNADLKVYNGTTLLTYNASPSSASQYSVSGAGQTGGGSITLGGGATVNDKITIYRDMSIARATDFPTSGAFQVDSLNEELDKLTAMVQQVENDTKYSPKFPQTTSTGFNLTFPELSASKVISVNSGGTALEAVHSIVDVQTVAGIAANVTTCAGVAANITTVAGIGASNINAVAGKATEIGLLGNADVIADMALLANADVIADMNTLATTDIVNDLNILATTDIVNDLNQLATSDFVSDLNAIEAIKANITTTANNITGINSFAERYRVHASDPTTDLDAGDLNFNTGSNELKYYDGSNWQTVASQDQNVKVTANDTSASVLNSKIAVSGGLTKTVTNAGSNETLTLTAQAAEVYGFELVDTDSDGIAETLRVHTTNGGADDISSTTYEGFDDVIYGASGMSWSLTTSGDLRVTI